MDCGWRRCGDDVYQPRAPRCCPMYTCRVAVFSFLASRAQRRVLRRLEQRPRLAAAAAVLERAEAAQQADHTQVGGG
jgi:arginyl-tRNA--protein-N-Asp/Glu arginylyltransferase